MICHPPRLHPERRPDTLLHKAAMSLESSAPSYGRHISPPLPPVPMQTIQSFVSPLSIPLFLIKHRTTGRKQSRPVIHIRQAGITVKHVPIPVFSYHFGSKLTRGNSTSFGIKTTIKSSPETLVFTGLQPRPKFTSVNEPNRNDFTSTSVCGWNPSSAAIFTSMVRVDGVISFHSNGQ